MAFTVEDALEALAEEFTPFTLFGGLLGTAVLQDTAPWDHRFVANTVAHVRMGRALSTEQAKIVLKLVSKHQHTLAKNNRASTSALEGVVRTPIYRQTPYPSANVPREVRYLGSNLLGFRFKYNDVIKQDLRKLHLTGVMPVPDLWYHREHRIWAVPVTQDNLSKVEDIISEHRFGFDEEVVGFLTRCHEVSNTNSTFLYDAELNVIAGQVCDDELLAWWLKHVIGGEQV